MKGLSPIISVFVLISFLPFGLNSQNLVPNYSFENYNECPFYPGNFNNFIVDWYNGAGTCDYFNACSDPPPNPISAGVPDNVFGYQDAITGVAYGGMQAYDPSGSGREYMQVVLTEPLVAGQCYNVGMYSTLADHEIIDYGVDKFGMYLSVDPPTPEPNGHIYVTPQVYYEEVVLDTANWVQLSGVFTAAGGEQYLTIGNFFPEGEFTLEQVGEGTFPFSYYFLENVRVELEEDLPPDDVEASICEGECFEYNDIQYCEPGEYEIPSESLCFGPATLTITISDDAIAEIADPEVLDCNTTTITLDATASSSGAGVTYQWTGPDNFSSDQQNPEVIEPGVYTLIVEGNNLCPVETNVEVLLDTIAPVVAASVSGPIDCNNDFVILYGATNTQNSTFHWTGPGVDINTPITTTNQVGIYTLTATGENGCTQSEVIEVLDDLESPHVAAEVSGVLICNDSLVTLAGNSTTPDVTYLWVGPGLDTIVPIATTNQPGEYNFTVLGPNGCIGDTTIIVLEEDIILDISAFVLDTLDCLNTSATLTGSSSVPNLTYQWSGPGILVDTTIAEATQAGEYTFSIMTESGCTEDTTVTVEQIIESPNINIQLPESLDCNTTSVEINASNSSGIGILIFEWQDLAGSILGVSPSLSVDSSGFYLLGLTDEENGCMAVDTVEIFQNVEAPIADAGMDGFLTCDNAEAILDGSNSTGDNLSYEWFDQNNLLLDILPITMASQAGLYTLIVTNQDNGCIDSASVTISPDVNIPTAIIDLNERLDCSTLEVTLDGSNSSSVNNDTEFKWLDELGNPISDTEEIVVNQPGFYTLIITDNVNGCSHSTQVEVMQDIEFPNALIDNTSLLNLDCNTSSFLLDGNASSPAGDISFEWSTLDGNILSDGDTPNPEIDQAGTYMLTVTNLSNSCISIDSISVSEDFSTPTAVILEAPLLTCTINQITLDASGSSTNGDFMYSWSSLPPDGIISGQNSLEPILNQPGVYTLSILNNENGCTTEAEIIVMQDIEAPIASANANEQFDCITEIVNLDGSNSSQGVALTYLWTGSGIIDNENSLSPTVYQPGLYSLMVTNQQNGCTAFDSVNVIENTNEPSGFIYELIVPNCFGDLGSIEILSVIEGQGPYLFSIDNGENFNQLSFFSSLEPGNYSVLVQDAIGCEYEQIFTIPFIDEIEVNLEPEVNLNFGDTYELEAQINFPNSEIDSIIWSPSFGLSCTDCLNPTVDALFETIEYSVTVINIYGCQSTDEVILRVETDREVFIPNIFSPHNGDGVNDLFMIYGNNNIKEITHFQIFDRWGELVFEAHHFQANDPSNAWNGIYKNERLNPGVFVYLAEIEFRDGLTKVYAGDVTLVD